MRRLLSELRIWLFPLSILLGGALAVFVLTVAVDAAHSVDPSHVLDLIVQPNPVSAQNTLGSAGEVVAAVLAIAITVVAIIVELASNRYTHRITELFVREPINFYVMGFFVITALQGLWVNLIIDYEPGRGGFVPYVSIGVSMAMLTLCLLILLPYFAFVFSFLNPISIVQRIRDKTLHGIEVLSGSSHVPSAQQEAMRGIEQLSDVSLNAMEHKDKGVSMAGVDALCSLLVSYQKLRPKLPESWFGIDGFLAHNPDFVSMAPEVLEDLRKRKVWLEWKILRGYQSLYNEALNKMRDINYLVAINSRLMAEAAWDNQNAQLFEMVVKFFNTYLRSAINAHDIRTAYNVLNQYRLVGETAVKRDPSGARALEIAKYFKYYGLLSFNAKLPFILETVAYDMCALIEFAFDQKSPATQPLLKIFLQVDKEGEGATQETSLRGVRKAQLKLASYFLLCGDEALAREVFLDMGDERPERLASIRDELLNVESREFWEVSDRGVNFDYLGDDRKAQLLRFFEWFGDRLPRARAATGGMQRAQPAPIPADAGNLVPAPGLRHGTSGLPGRLTTMASSPRHLPDAPPTRVEVRSRRPPSREVNLDEPEVLAREDEVASYTVRSIVDRQLQQRMELFAPLVLVLVLLVAATSILLGGDPLARNVLLGTLAVGAIGSGSTLYLLRRGGHLDARHVVMFGVACAVPLNGAFYYWGVLSGVLVLLPLGAFVFPVGRTRYGMLAAGSVLSTHVLLSSLTILGVIEDRGLMRPHDLSPLGQWLSLFFADAIAVAAYFIGRNSERNAEHALRELDKTARDAAQRGELLAEARFDLARALRAGRAGRFTGQSLGGYTLGMVLGRGAMGEVYEGTSPSGEPCAVKLLHLHLVSDKNHYARFVREARIAASLNVPNVVRVMEASDENAVLPYLVMERLSGVDLGAHLGEVIKLEPKEVLVLLRQIASGVDAAHAVGIVHRDLKPQNIFRADLGGEQVIWKVLDFGVSKLRDQNATISQGVVVGTPQYMAPEQARGDAVDGRADFYSLALIIYRALTGRPAFIVSDVHALLAIASTRMPPRPSDMVQTPTEVDDVIAVAMSKDPKDRFATASAFADALELAFQGRIAPELRKRAQEVLARWPWDDPARDSADAGRSSRDPLN